MQNSGDTSITLDLESPIEAQAGPGNIVCISGGKQLALLNVGEKPQGRIALLNTHTYSQADFDAVGEVLLCPRPLGLLEINGPALATLREAFGSSAFDGPGCVTFHPFGPSHSRSCVIQNFNDNIVNVSVTMPIGKGKSGQFAEAFSGTAIVAGPGKSRDNVTLHLSVPARGRVWVRPID